MRCFFIFAIAVALAASIDATGWSQTAGGGGGGAGAAGASNAGTGVTGEVPGGSATGTVPGGSATGTVPGGSPTGAVPGGSATGGVSANGTAANAGAAGTAGVGTNGVRAGANTGVGANGRVNNTAGLPNSATRVGVNQNFSGINRTPFFTDPNVRQQLNLNTKQYGALNRAYQNAYTRYNQAAANLNPNLTEQQRELQLQQLQAQFNQDLSGTVNSTFTNPQMLSRYNQLNRQFMGFNAFNDPSIRQQLNLTPDQTRQLRMLSNNWRQQLQQFRRGAGNDLNSVDTNQWNQLWQQYATQLNGVLTPEQQQMWAQQVGQPVTFSPNVVFGGEQSGNVGVDNPPAVDPTVPRFFPNAGATRGAQPQNGTRQATTQGTTAPNSNTQGTQSGTVR